MSEETSAALFEGLGGHPLPYVPPRPSPVDFTRLPPAATATRIPPRWLTRADGMRPDEATAFIRRKLMTGGVGRKLRRTLRRARLTVKRPLLITRRRTPRGRTKS